MKRLEQLREAGVGRMRWWAALAAASVALIAWRAPHQIDVLLVKANLLSIAAWAGYWLDRSAFHAEPRPHEIDRDSPAYGAVCLRRAIVIAGTMIAVALAL
jgi:hypothetical protein